jgi:hypothetical protein
LNPEKAAEVFQKIGPNYLMVFIEPNLRAAIREATASHSANALYSGEREMVANQIRAQLTTLLGQRGIIVESILLRDIQLPQTLKSSIESKQQAEQEALAMNFRLQKEKQEAERKRIEAAGIRDFQQIVAQGISPQLLDGRVVRAIHLDASTAYLTVAREETARRDHGSRVEFLHGDFVAVADRIPAADLVTLDRVICCYDDMERLVGLSAAKTMRLYGAVYPRKHGWMRLAIATINVVQRLKRSSFRVFLHDPAAIDAVLRASGLERRSMERTLGWEVAVYQRQLHGGVS